MEAKYTRVYETLKRDILSGKYSSRDSFPSVAMIIRRFEISNLTAVKVLEKLKNDGLVKSYQGRGTFVTKLATVRKIGLIVPGVASCEFYPRLISEISRLVHDRGYELLLGECHSPDANVRENDIGRLVREFIGFGVSGIIYRPAKVTVSGKDMNLGVLTAFAKRSIPVVLVDSDVLQRPIERAYDVVTLDNEDAGEELARHLIGAGARRIAFFKCPGLTDNVQRRIRGVKDCCLKSGLAWADSSVLECRPDDLNAIRRYFRRSSSVDAMVCDSDSSAAILCQTLRRIGLSVPRDVMVAGFDDMKIAQLAYPSLTTMRQPCAEIARRAFEKLLHRIEYPRTQQSVELVSASLVVRSSTMCNQRKKTKTRKGGVK